MIPAHSSVSLPEVRRLEAVSFRSWPAATTRFDGTWAIRLTAGHTAKRLNSLNPLDPADHSNLDERISRAARAFQAFGRPLVFRQSPLAPPELENRLDARGWRRFDETNVMTLDLEKAADSTIDHLPYSNIGHWIDQSVAMGSIAADLKPGLSELIARVQGEVALFLSEDANGTPLAAAMAVRFGDLAGLFEIASHPSHRRQGNARKLIKSALSWAQSGGASRAWLQVVADNEPAVELYQSLGFTEIYSYAYRQAPEGFNG